MGGALALVSPNFFSLPRHPQNRTHLSSSRAASDIGPPISLSLWPGPQHCRSKVPPSQSSRDSKVRILLQKLAGPSLYCVYYGAVPEPEARRAAAAIEVESLASVSEYVSGVTLASRQERFAVYKMYLHETCVRLLGFFKSRAAAMGGMLEPAPTLALAASAAASEE